MKNSRSFRNPKKYKNKKNNTSSLNVSRKSTTWNIRSGKFPLTVSPRWDNVPYKIVRSFNLSTVLTTSTTVVQFAGIYFTLTNVDLADGLNTVFDQYRIRFVECCLAPVPGATATQEQLESVEWASRLDFDNATPPSAFANVLDSPSAFHTYATVGHCHRWQPHVAEAAYAGAFTSYANHTSPWIDCVSSSVQHFGLVVATLPSALAFTIVGTGRFHLEFRNVI
jgi:hypothetical protein